MEGTHRWYNIFANGGGRRMKRISAKKRAWLENRRRKLLRFRARQKKRAYHSNRSAYIEQSESASCRSFIAPENFSLMNNLEETLRYFYRVTTAIRRCHPNTTIYFDFSSIADASPEAFMYIIALLKNNKRIQKNQIFCAGNEPLAPQPRDILNRAGFFQYVRSTRFHALENEESQLRIYRGTQSDPLLAQKICDFVHARTESSINRLGTKRLFPMYIELMNNVKQHAFGSESSTESAFCNWYTYAEDIGNELRFVFLDTGKGIPETIRKNLLEKLSIVGSDSRFIASALEGAFRTDTGDKHRGKGLPEIYDNVKKHAIDSLCIFSGNGLCIVDSYGRITEYNLQHAFNGTMYVWTIKKEKILYD